jgi:hypothetical protein
MICKDNVFHSGTALPHMRIVYQAFKSIDSDPYPDMKPLESEIDYIPTVFKYLDHMIVTILASHDDFAHVMLLQMTAEHFLFTDQRIQLFFDSLSTSSGSKLMQTVDAMLYTTQTELYKTCAIILTRLFDFSPAMLQRKFGYNLRQFINMILYVIEKNGVQCHLFYLTIIDTVDNIWKYIGMRNHSSVPIRSKKLYSDIHDIMASLLSKCESFLGKIKEEDRFLEEVFRTTYCLIRLLNMRFAPSKEWVPKWIKYAETYKYLNVRLESIRVLGGLLRNNEDTMQEYLPTLKFAKVMGDFVPLLESLENEIITCLFALLDSWMKHDMSAPIKFQKEGGFKVLVPYVSLFSAKATRDNEQAFGYVVYLSRILATLFKNRMFSPYVILTLKSNT